MSKMTTNEPPYIIPSDIGLDNIMKISYDKQFEKSSKIKMKVPVPEDQLDFLDDESSNFSVNSSQKKVLSKKLGDTHLKSSQITHKWRHGKTEGQQTVNIDEKCDETSDLHDSKVKNTPGECFERNNKSFGTYPNTILKATLSNDIFNISNSSTNSNNGYTSSSSNNSLGYTIHRKRLNSSPCIKKNVQISHFAKTLDVLDDPQNSNTARLGDKSARLRASSSLKDFHHQKGRQNSEHIKPVLKTSLTFEEVPRNDKKGRLISSGSKNYGIVFLDEVETDIPVASTIEVESYKAYNLQNSYGISSRCTIQ